MVGEVIREKCNPYLTDYDHPGRSHEQLHPAHPTKVLFGEARWPSCAARSPATPASSSPTAVAAWCSGLLDQIRSELAGLTLFEFGGIEPNPHL